MTAIIALFPGDEDGIVLRQWGGTVCACHDCRWQVGLVEPGLYRLDWSNVQDEPLTVIRLSDLPAIPEAP